MKVAKDSLSHKKRLYITLSLRMEHNAKSINLAHTSVLKQSLTGGFKFRLPGQDQAGKPTLQRQGKGAGLQTEGTEQ